MRVGGQVIRARRADVGQHVPGPVRQTRQPGVWEDHERISRHRPRLEDAEECVTDRVPVVEQRDLTRRGRARSRASSCIRPDACW